MSSVDTRIKHEARLFKRELEAVHGRRLERLRLLLKDEVGNMLARCANAGNDAKDNPTAWLHGKTFDQTYRDYGLKGKQYRTKVRIEAILMLCGGDEKLFLDEYARALKMYFPIKSKSFEWAPRLLKTDSGRVTVVHRWRRVQG